MELLAEEYLKKNDPLRKKSSSSPKASKTASSEKPSHPKTLDKTKCRTPASLMKPKTIRKTTRYIPKKTREEVYRRAQGQCQYKDPKTGRLCGSKYKTQIDHIVPFSQRGSNAQDNLQLLCASHNGLKGARRSLE
jgi:CRISPR/Cas system Type II protein with McrA/HNH and RuvC-like nuclease domain